jgi:hypothetical protein
MKGQFAGTRVDPLQWMPSTQAERMVREAEERAKDADRWSGARFLGQIGEIQEQTTT